MSGKLRLIAGAGVLAAAAIQFIRPPITHPPVTADLAAPAEVKQILKESCYDCHSNETRLAWFDQIVPAYWLVASDVRQARARLNFSDIGALPPAQQKGTLYEAVNQIQFGAMPLANYTRLHPSAVLTPSQLAVLKNYLNPAPAASTPASNDLAADDTQYQDWIRAAGTDVAVEPAPNGIQFPRDYKNWKAISTTDRLDNQSMRAILGNDVAINAIAAGRTNPWPDGATFAKIAWAARNDSEGRVQAGAFVQVEFMIRDAKKYAATKGWGWARWRGAGLKPYGKDADFTTECVGCHTPLRNNDYVFTVPLRVEQLPPNSREWNVITVAMDRGPSTMSTLYGNDAAIQHARTGSPQDYPAGAELSLVTWAQREDPHWFGARIPAEVKSVERLVATAGPDGKVAYSYELYEGSPLARTQTSQDHSAGTRAAYLLSLRAAVMP